MTGISAIPKSSRSGEVHVCGDDPELKVEGGRLLFGVSIVLTTALPAAFATAAPRRKGQSRGRPRPRGERCGHAAAAAGPAAAARAASGRQKYRHAERESLPFIFQFGGVAPNASCSHSRRDRDSRGPGHEGLYYQLIFSRRKRVKSTCSGPEVSMDLQVHFER